MFCSAVSLLEFLANLLDTLGSNIDLSSYQILWSRIIVPTPLVVKLVAYEEIFREYRIHRNITVRSCLKLGGSQDGPESVAGLSGG
jgi:hypothetical protein